MIQVRNLKQCAKETDLLKKKGKHKRSKVWKDMRYVTYEHMNKKTKTQTNKQKCYEIFFVYKKYKNKHKNENDTDMLR